MAAPVTQLQLHQIIRALYSKQLQLNMDSAEPILRAAHLMDIRCIVSAAEVYIAKHFIPIAPVEVHPSPLQAPLHAAALPRPACSAIMEPLHEDSAGATNSIYSLTIFRPTCFCSWTRALGQYLSLHCCL